MKVSVWALVAGLFTLQAQAAPQWEVCLDDADFTLSVNDSFLNYVRVAKSGCVLRFVNLGGKGEKFEVNLCDAFIHIDHFDSIDTIEYTRHVAGSAGCPLPMFGSDFDDRIEELRRYEQTKAGLFNILATVNKKYGANLAKIDLAKITAKDLGNSEVKTACINYLTGEYLRRCTSFEAKKKIDDKPIAAPIPIGVHPETIHRKQ